MSHEQLDMTGGSVPLAELELRGHSLALAAAEREHGRRLDADEAGALVHARRGKHGVDERCVFCSPDGTEALIALNTRRHQITERERLAAEGTPWSCPDCGKQNSADRTLCGGCASSQDDDPEPPVRFAAPDPSTAEIPF